MSSRTSASILSGRQFSMAILIVIAALAVAAGAWQWWNNVSTNPQRVFWGMMQNNLANTGVTISQSSDNSGTKTMQVNQMDFSPSRLAETITTFTLGGAEVRTLELSTPTRDYTKYLTIDTGKSTAATKVKAANVLNVWANTTSSTSSKDTGVPSTFSTVLLSQALPIGNVSQANQAALLNEIRSEQVYTPVFNKVQKRQQDGRLQYIYTVSMQPILYVQLMKNFAQDMGMHELDSVDPNSYETNVLPTMQWTVDARSRQLVEVAYDGHTESYSAYGVQIHVTPPIHAISGTVLQNRVNTLNAQI